MAVAPKGIFCTTFRGGAEMNGCNRPGKGLRSNTSARSQPHLLLLPCSKIILSLSQNIPSNLLPDLPHPSLTSTLTKLRQHGGCSLCYSGGWIHLQRDFPPWRHNHALQYICDPPTAVQGTCASPVQSHDCAHSSLAAVWVLLACQPSVTLLLHLFQSELIKVFVSHRLVLITIKLSRLE